MKTELFLSVAALIFATGCGNNSGQSSAQTNTVANTNQAGVMTAPADYLGTLGRGRQYAEKTVDTASVNKAIQMFQVDKGRYPKDLNELVRDKYLTRLPEAPYGMKLDYDPNTGQVKVVKQ